MPQPCPEEMYERSAHAGAYAAPPRTGEVAGESETMGITGGAIQIPAINLRLPTFQLPGLVRFRRNAHVVLDTAHAPFTEAPRREFYVDAGPRIDGVLEERSAADAPRSADAYPPPAPSCLQEEIRQLRLRERFLEERLRQLESCLQQRGTPPAPPAQRDTCPGGQCPPRAPARHPVEELPENCVPRPNAHPTAGVAPVAPPVEPDLRSFEQRTAALEQQVVFLARYIEQLHRQRSLEAESAAASPAEQNSEIRFRNPGPVQQAQFSPPQGHGIPPAAEAYPRTVPSVIDSPHAAPLPAQQPAAGRITGVRPIHVPAEGYRR